MDRGEWDNMMGKFGELMKQMPPQPAPGMDSDDDEDDDKKNKDPFSGLDPKHLSKITAMLGRIDKAKGNNKPVSQEDAQDEL